MVDTRAPTLFAQCEDAIRKGVLIERESARDKEFAAQGWVRDRLEDAGLGYEESGRNTYPDFLLLGTRQRASRSRAWLTRGEMRRTTQTASRRAASTEAGQSSTCSCGIRRAVGPPTQCMT